jgi:hypothetical protein
MKTIRLAAAAVLLAAAPAFAATTVIDFEKVTSFDSVGSPVAGITFGGDALGLVNDEYSTFFTNAPSPVGVMTVVGADATMNVAAGFTSSFSFAYSSASLMTSAVNVYSGLNGTGNLLASFNLVNNATAGGCTSSDYCHFDLLSTTFAGTAYSVTFGNAVGAAFDNISVNVSAVPEASTTLLMALGLIGMGAFVQRRRQG